MRQQILKKTENWLEKRPILPYREWATWVQALLYTGTFLESILSPAWFQLGKVGWDPHWYAHTLGRSKPKYNKDLCPLLTASKFGKNTRRNLQKEWNLAWNCLVWDENNMVYKAFLEWNYMRHLARYSFRKIKSLSQTSSVQKVHPLSRGISIIQ